MADRFEQGLRPEDVALLRCPLTGAELRLVGHALVSVGQGIRYPIVDGVPVLLPEAAIREGSEGRSEPEGP